MKVFGIIRKSTEKPDLQIGKTNIFFEILFYSELKK